MRILIVEDEIRLADAIAEILRSARYAVDVVHDGIAGLDYALSGIYDAIVLDVMLPGKNGFEVVRELRSAGDATPVLLLTARTGVESKVMGLDSGADYYLTKPFDNQELLACIRAISRRSGEVATGNPEFADLILDLAGFSLLCKGRKVILGAKEFQIMQLFLANPLVVVPKEDILLKVWGGLSEAEDNNVEAYISFLRKKLYFLKSRVSIETRRKVGYFLRENTDAEQTPP